VLQEKELFLSMYKIGNYQPEKAYKTSFSKFVPYVFCKETLILETYIVGYKTEGEAIIFFIKSDGKISFSGLVDCFNTTDVDKVKEILSSNNVDKLDFICWTHPDFDHSKGLKDIVDCYAKEDTGIWIPEGVDEKDIGCSKDVQDFFSYLKDNVVKRNNDFNVYSASDKKDLLAYNPIHFRKNYDEYPLKITSYAPNSKQIRRQNYLEKFIKNDRSICFTIEIGKVKLLLTGDIENEMIKSVKDSIKFGGVNQHVHILKIPHHGSETSTGIVNVLVDDCDVACATVYRKGKVNLPEPRAMQVYHKHTRGLYCTGKHSQAEESDKYGVLKVTTDIFANTYDISLEGNATAWSRETEVS